MICQESSWALHFKGVVSHKQNKPQVVIKFCFILLYLPTIRVVRKGLIEEVTFKQMGMTKRAFHEKEVCELRTLK